MASVPVRTRLAKLSDKLGKQHSVIEAASTEGGVVQAKRNVRKYAREYVELYCKALQQGAITEKDDPAGIISGDNLVEGSYIERVVNELKVEFKMSDANVTQDNLAIRTFKAAVETGKAVKVKFSNGVHVVYDPIHDKVVMMCDGVTRMYSNIKEKLKKIIEGLIEMVKSAYGSVKGKFVKEELVTA